MDEQTLLTHAASIGTPALHARYTPESGSSYLGGAPELPAGSEWPTGRNPHSFLAQLDLATIHSKMAIDWLPQSGKLLFFYDMECGSWGFDPDEYNCWKVEYVPEGTATAQVQAPENAEVFEKRCLDFRAINTYSQEYDILPAGHTMSEDAYYDFIDQVRQHDFHGQPMHQILGKPYAIQNEEMETECELVSKGVNCGRGDDYQRGAAQLLEGQTAEWRLLFQIDSDDDAGWMWGDSGILYFWVRESDARKGDFSKVWLILQCC